MIHLFWEALKTLPGTPCRLLECGSHRQKGQPAGQGQYARLHRADVQITGLDAEPGEGVDVVADLHALHELSAVGWVTFDAILICSTLEHVRRPWVVAKELAGVTRPGGVLFCATHQSFPLHGYPSDYFRFSVEALAEVFAPDAGWDVLAKGYECPCKVIPLDNEFIKAHDWNFSAESFILSWCLCRRRRAD